MRVGDQVDLACTGRVLGDAYGRILALAAGRSVLNVGAAGGVEGYLPGNRGAWLHHRLAETARELAGIDVDTAAIAHAARHGVALTAADCQRVDLGRRFEVIVLSDVIEHLDAPGHALVNLARHLEPGGRLLVTTPNPTALGAVLAAVRGGRQGIYWDHMAAFLPEHLQALCDRHGLVMQAVGWFTLADRRTASTRAKSAVLRGVGRLFPQLNAAFLAEIGVAS